MVKLNYEWDWDGAGREFRRAIALNPSSIDAHDRYATYLIAMGRFDEAVGEARRALALDPLSAYANAHAGWISMTARRYEEGADQLGKALALDPDLGTAHLFRAWCYTLNGDYARALADYDRWGDRDTDVGVAFLLGVMGRREEALRIIRNVKVRAAKEYSDPYDLAIAYAGLDDADNATQANDATEETGASRWHPLRRMGDGTRGMVGDPKRGRSHARAASRTSSFRLQDTRWV